MPAVFSRGSRQSERPQKTGRRIHGGKTDLAREHRHWKRNEKEEWRDKNFVESVVSKRATGCEGSRAVVREPGAFMDAGGNVGATLAKERSVLVVWKCETDEHDGKLGSPLSSG